MQKPGDRVDRRQFGRRKTSLHAWISVAGRPKLHCVVADLSVGGALLQLDAPAWMPYNFVLTIESSKFVTWCEVRHQKKTDAIGVRFLSAAEAAVLDAGTRIEGRSMDDRDAWAGARNLLRRQELR